MANDDDIETEKDEAARKRIIATLLAFSALALRLCAASRPLRFMVLWFLRRAEKIARDMVLRGALECGARALPGAMIADRCRQTIAEAERMAMSFRAMAWALEHMQRLPA